MRRSLLSTAIALSSAICPVPSEAQSAAGEWTHYHRDLSSTRYSPLDQINKDNVSKLALAWTWVPDSAGTEIKNENTPLMVGGVLYVTAGQHRNVAALDAATGKQIWRWHWEESPTRFRFSPRQNSGRGVAYWSRGPEARIFVVTASFRLVALDAKTGIPVESFGDRGFVDLKANLGWAPMNLDSAEIGNSSPPIVFENTVVIGPALREGGAPASYRNVPGRVLAFDAVTGKMKWRFNTIPLKDEPGYETWLNGSAEYTGNVGVWAPMTVDARRGYLYLPVEDATGDYYGGHRHGDNLYSASIVCLDIRTGKRVWHYQLVHHDIWDRDTPTAPVLMDLNVGGRRIEAVAQITKQAYVYVFDRATGKPVWPIEERPVPQTDVPGEWTAKTQPHPTKPPPFDRQGITIDDLIDYTPALRARALEMIKPYRLGQLWTPPSLALAPDSTRGTLSVPSSVGGANWEHGSYDAETGTLFVGSFTSVTNLALRRDSVRSDMRYVGGGGGNPRPEGLPLLKPPYNRITAIDMNKGEIRWTVPGGDTPDAIKNNPALAGVNIGVTGATTRPAVMATKTLLFASEGYGSRPILHVFDKQTGARLADIPVPGSIGGSPMTYAVNGKQYVAVWVGRQGFPARLVTLALP
jgi:quinoprotein glucose dehydrogenase